MSDILSWNEIKQQFGGVWVELIQVEWDWNTPYPTQARVRNHAVSYHDLCAKIQKTGHAPDGVVLHLGAARSIVEHDAAVAVL